MIDNPQKLVGMLEMGAVGTLVTNKTPWKVIKRDGKVLPSSMTMDYVSGMVYLFVEHGIVTRVIVNR